MRCRAALTCSSLLLASSVSWATSQISGEVQDPYGNGFADCRITTHSGNETRTAEDGSFQINVEPGAPLRVECPLAEPQTVEDWDTPLTVVVRYAGLEDFEVVSKLRVERARVASTTSISQRDIAAVPIRTAEDALRLVPGLVLTQHGSEGKGHQYFLRGFDAIHGADLEVEVAGIPINEWSNVHAQGYIDLGFVIPETIGAVRVVKGPFTLDEGLFAMAGSAHYRLGIPSEDRGFRVSYTLGTTLRNRVMGSWADPDSSDFVALEAVHDEGYGERRRVDRATASSMLEIAGAELFITAYHADFELPGTIRNQDFEDGRMGFFDAYDEVSQGESSRLLVGLSDRYEERGGRLEWQAWASARRLRLFENFTGYLIDEDRGDWRQQAEESLSLGLELDSMTRIIEGVSLRLGMGQRLHFVDQREFETGMNREGSESRRDLVASQFASHALAGMVWMPVPQFSVHAGTRLDVIYVHVDEDVSQSSGSGADGALSPRVSARWSLPRNLALFFAYGRGIRPPEARAFSDFDPDRLGITEEEAGASDARITQSDAFELGTSWQPSHLFGARLSGFATVIGEEAVFDHVSGLNLALNATRRLGGEIALFSDPLPWLSVMADATIVDARFVESGRSVPHAPWLVGGGRVIMTHPSGFVGGLRGLLVAPRTLPQGARSGTHVVFDGSLGYHLDSWRFDLRVENIIARRLREGEYHYASDWRLGPRSELPALHYVAGPPLNAKLTVTALF